MRIPTIALLIAFIATGFARISSAAPHGQNREPGPALTPDQAIAKMQLPPGFKAECIAHEPDLINPTAFTFDDRGRIWVTESIEYPRASAGPGQDRVKILEDVNHNGKYEKATIFKDGLNIPCGVALGNGGVYITNSPDILFLQDTKGDGHADKQEVILTGFGRDDRHELPNSLTWGPDGWLYGMNGVFNQSHLKDAEGTQHDFTCAVWRYHPKTKKFELFAEGTSNPWGLDFNRQGDWFLSCCVIDHLFHITQSGYYERQGGPYPPMTHRLRSITTQRHQAAAYGGLCFYDADAFPEEYRGTLFMGNLHGSCINRDTLTRDGSTYVQHNAASDFISANDAWFMPVSEKIGPDGCLYIMDWYDRYHCYQDAGRDPKGIDRTMGRIYRISYNDTPRAQPFDLEKSSNEDLIKLLSNPNVWWRREAQRLLNERFEPSLVPVFEKMALETSDTTPAHMHALWILVSQAVLDPAFHMKVLTSADEPTRNWGARAVGQLGTITPEVFEKFKLLANDSSQDVRLQTAVAAGRLTHPDPMPVFLALLDNPANSADPLIPTILYSNLKALVAARGPDLVSTIVADETAEKNFGNTVVQWLHDFVAAGRTPKQIVAHLKEVLARPGVDERDRLRELRTVADGLVSAGLKPADRAKLFDVSTRQSISGLAKDNSPLRVPATLVALWWDDAAALESARSILADAHVDAPTRSQLLRAMSERRDPANIPAFAAFVSDANAPVLLRQRAVDALGEMDDPQAAEVLVQRYPQLGTDLKPMAMNALVRTKSSAQALLDALADKKIPLSDMNENHARRIIALNDADLSKQLASVWGTVRTDRDPERIKIVEQMKKMVMSHAPGDPKAGWKVFETRCTQCHTIYGHGGDIGPNLTGVGRETLDAILSNVVDPNLVVGAPYYQYVAKLKNGTVATGLLAEDAPDHIVLRDNSQRIVIRREDLKELRQTHLSMMPEGLEKTMTDQEFCDLVAFLLTREPPK